MGNIENVQKYIDENQPLNLKNKFGVNLIHVFATLDSSKLKKFDEYFLKNPELLLDKINTPEKKCKNVYYCEGITIFHILATKGNKDLLQKALMLKPEGKDQLNSDQELPLHLASRHCKYEAIKLLIDFKSDINKVSSDLFSPLMVSAKNGCKTSTMVLVKAGAKLDFKNKKGETALDIAKKNKYNETAFIVENLK